MVHSSPFLDRRAYLRGIAGTATLPFIGSVDAAQTYSPLGTVTVEGAKEAVVGENNEVYVAATNSFAVVDVSEPSSPTIIAEKRGILADEPGGPLTSIADVKVDGDRLLVASPAYPEADKEYLRAVAVYDVSDPSAPALLNWKKTGMMHHNVFIRDGVVYLSGYYNSNHPLVMVDLETLEELGRWSLTAVEPDWKQVPPLIWPLHDLWVQDGVAYLAYWDAGTWMVDVSDPGNPSVITKVRGRPPSAFMALTDEEARDEYLQQPGNDHSVTVNDAATLLAIGEEAWDIPPSDPQVGPGGIELFDISEPTQPKSLSRIEPPSIPTDTSTTVHNFEIVGDRLYSAWYAGGVRLFDVSDPANPTETRSWHNPQQASFWAARAVRPGEFFTASDRGEGRSDEDGRLYTFPEPPLKNEDTHEPTTPETIQPTKTTPTTTTTTTTTTQPTITTTQSTEQQPTTGSPSGDGTDASGPGFGIAAAVAALGGGVWHSLRTNR